MGERSRQGTTFDGRDNGPKDALLDLTVKLKDKSK
jgi:hypothetical protein